MQLPSDPMMLYSVLNTRLRDTYPNLEALCEDCGADPSQLMEKMRAAGFVYDVSQNQFIDSP